MIYALAITAICTMPTLDGTIHDSFDALEINHYYSNEGEHVFDQLIAWNWSESHNAFVVEAWRLWKTDRHPQKRSSGGYEIVFDDGDVTRRVTGKVFWETFTQRDREMENRSVYEKSLRTDFTKHDDHYRRSTDTPSEANDSDLELTP